MVEEIALAGGLGIDSATSTASIAIRGIQLVWYVCGVLSHTSVR
jgi:hypothetical protein